MVTERIQIIVSEQGARVVKRNLEDIGQGARKGEEGISLLKRALSALSVGLIVRELARMADSYTTILNRVRLVTQGTAQLNLVTNELFNIANKTRQPVGALSELYQKGSLAAKELGASQQELLKFTENIGFALAQQGGSSAAASGALLQLSQALGAGIVRAEEFNSILEGGFPIALAAAKGIERAGGSVAKLRQLVIAGKVTSQEFFTAILSQSEDLAAQFKKSNSTIGQSFTVLQNKLTETVGKFDTTFGISRSFANSLLFLSENLDTVGRVALATAITLGTVLAVKGIGAVITAVNALTLAIAANPLGAFLLLITGSIALLTAFSDQILIGGDNFTTLRDLAVVTWDAIKSGLNTLATVFNKTFGGMSTAATESFSNINLLIQGVVLFAAFAIDKITGVFGGLSASIILGLEGLPAAIRDIFNRALNGAIAIVESGVNTIIGAFNSVTTRVGVGAIEKVTLSRFENAAKDGAKDLANTVSTAFTTGLEKDSVLTFVEGIFGKAQTEAKNRIAEQAAVQKELENSKQSLEKKTGGTGGTGSGDGVNFSDLFAKLVKEGEALKLNNQEREVANQKLQFENSLKRELTATEATFVESQLLANQAMAAQADILDEIRAPQEEYGKSVTALKGLLDRGKIALGEYANKLNDVRIAYLETQTDLASGAERAFLKINKDIGDSAKGMEDLLTNAFKNSEDAIVEFAKTGKLSFSGLVDGLISDLIRLQAREALSSIFGSILGKGGAAGGANIGASILGFVQGFAKGDVFSSPTAFQYGNGQLGVMGEAGPEAVMPLARGADGSLGIRVNGKTSGGDVYNITNSIVIENNNSGGGQNKPEDNQRMGQMVQQAIDQSMAEFVRKQQKTGGMFNNRVVA